MLEPNQNLPPLPPHPPATPKWKKAVKYTFVTLGILLGLILLAGILIPIFFEDQIKGLFINELNKNLATEVSIKEEDIDLSLFKNFPEASVVFHNVGIRESFSHSDKNFLQAEEISLLFNFRSIINGNYVIKNIVIKNGYCNLITDKRGNINYHFWKSSGSSSSDEFSLNLQKVICSDIDFEYLDYRYHQDIALRIHSAVMSGNFSSDFYVMDATGSVLSKRIRIGGSNYLVNKEAEVDSRINVAVPGEKYSFEKTTVVIDKNSFAVNGAVTLLNEDFYDLTINGDKINLEGLMLLLPGSVSGNLNALKSKGDINFSTTIKGFYTHTKTPNIDIAFDVKNGSITHDKFGGTLDHMHFKGAFTNGEQHNNSTSSIRIENFSAEQNGSPVTMELQYSNFSNPYINLQLNGSFPASILIPTAIKNAGDVEGTIDLNNINIKGNLKNLSNAITGNKPTGNIQFNQVAFTINGEKVAIEKGIATVNNNTILFAGFHPTFAGSDMQLDLEVNNWIENVFPAEYKPPLHLDGSIRSEKIELNKLLTAFQGKETAKKEDEAAAPITATENTRYNFSGTIDLACNEFLYEKIRFADIHATLKLTPGMLIVSDLRGNAMGGTFALNTTGREMPNGDILLQTSGTITGIDVAELFTEFDNFDQHTLTDKNIKGKITANIYDVSMKWDPHFILDESSIYVLSDMKIENGELIDYKPLESLSGFVKMQDLKHIVFSTMENKIEIKDKVIQLPATQIKSNALDMYVSGKHSFDNHIDYQFRISLADMMVRKFLGGNKQKDNYEEDAEGGVNVYVSMTGTVDDPVIEYNKREAKQKLKESGLEEQKFIDIFKRDPEEQMFKKETAPEEKNAASDSSEEIQFIEFDEEDQ